MVCIYGYQVGMMRASFRSLFLQNETLLLLLVLRELLALQYSNLRKKKEIYYYPSLFAKKVVIV